MGILPDPQQDVSCTSFSETSLNLPSFPLDRLASCPYNLAIIDFKLSAEAGLFLIPVLWLTLLKPFVGQF
jgi:hypothetical protein